MQNVHFRFPCVAQKRRLLRLSKWLAFWTTSEQRPCLISLLAVSFSLSYDKREFDKFLHRIRAFKIIVYRRIRKLAKQLGPSPNLVEGKRTRTRLRGHAKRGETSESRACILPALFVDHSQSTKMAARATRYHFAVEKINFLRLRNALKCLGILCRSRHSECLVELEVGGQWVCWNEFTLYKKKVSFDMCSIWSAVFGNHMPYFFMFSKDLWGSQPEKWRN